MGLLLIGFFIVVVSFIAIVQIIMIVQDKKSIRRLIEESGSVIRIRLGSPLDVMVHSGPKHSYTNYYKVEYIGSDGVVRRALMKRPGYDGLEILEEKIIKRN